MAGVQIASMLGGSVIVDADGAILAGPLYEAQGILYADIDLGRLGTLRRVLDVTGHYARPDVFMLHVNHDPNRVVADLGHVASASLFDDDAAASAATARPEPT